MFDSLSLHPDLIKGLEKQSLTEPTEVQTAAIPVALTGADLLVSAETGSGKTLAFLLPTFQRLLTTDDNKQGTRALVLVPTRELASQVYDECMALGSYTHLKFGIIVGGESSQKQRALLRKNPEILIATPGRLMDLIGQDAAYLGALEVLILDEADRMLDMGFSADVLTIAAACNSERQSLLFSATLDNKEVMKVASHALREPKTIKLNSIRDKHEYIDQQVMLADDYEHKVKLLEALAKEDVAKKTLVFVNKRDTADRLNLDVRKTGLRAAALHGEMDQAARKQVMKRFQDGVINVLVATDVAARGLDVSDIGLVINFDIPRNGHDYVHRIGRTGRAGERGIAVSLVVHAEWNVMAGIERYLGQKCDRRLIAELKGTYQGPKKVKASGKSAGKKKAKGAKATDKSKQRHRNKKQIGKRRKPASSTSGEGGSEAEANSDRGKPVTDSGAIAKATNGSGWSKMKRRT